MNAISASAPGKIVVCGEYAVLWGAPAVCMAVNRRAEVSIESATGPDHCITAKGVIDGEYRFDIGENGLPHWQNAAGLRLVDEIWRELGVGRIAPVRMTVDTSGFVDPLARVKYGFGSSAAVAVALCAALGREGPAATSGSHAAAAHRRYQGGRGSGVDVACSIAGGLIGFRMAGGDQPDVLAWPSGLRYQVLWSGRASDTARQVGKMQAVDQRDGALQNLVQAAEKVASHWARGNSSAIVEAIDAYIDALTSFDQRFNVGIFEAGHANLTQLARDRGLVYKPCGAGGGDTGIAMTAAQDGRLEGFVAEALRLGFSALDVNMDSTGLVVQREAA